MPKNLYNLFYCFHLGNKAFQEEHTHHYTLFYAMQIMIRIF